MASSDIDKIIISLVSAQQIHDQQHFMELLSNQGINLNQPGLSRRLSKLKITKESGIYKLPLNFSSKSTPIIDITIAKPNIIVIHTLGGFAGSIAAEIDNERRQGNKAFSGLLGTIAGDDTILAVAKTPESLTKIVENIKKHFIK